MGRVIFMVCDIYGVLRNAHKWLTKNLEESKHLGYLNVGRKMTCKLI